MKDGKEDEEEEDKKKKTRKKMKKRTKSRKEGGWIYRATKEMKRTSRGKEGEG